MQTDNFESIYSLSNRDALLNNNVRTILFVVKKLKIKITASTLIRKIILQDNFPALTIMDLTSILSFCEIDTYATSMNSIEAVQYGSGSIMHIKSNEENDFIYIEKFTKKSVRYFHPLYGLCEESVDQFKKKWSGITILLENSSSNILERNFNEHCIIENTEINRYKKSIHVIDNFINKYDCERIIDICEDQNLFNRSKVINNANYADEDSTRTSYSAYINNSTSLIFNKINSEVSKLVNRPISEVEGLQCVRYNIGQQFKFHYDSLTPGLNRLYTVLIYLNDDYIGGETYFPLIDLKISPAVGKALVFRNIEDDLNSIVYSAHAGIPVISGIKYALNVWIR